MAVNRLVKFAIVTAGVLSGLFVLAVVGTMMFVFSIGTATVTTKVTATVFDRQQGKPVAGCLLAFEKGFDGRPGDGRTSAHTDASGQSTHESTHSYGGSIFWPFDRDRRPTLRLYIGEPPTYTRKGDVETWDLHLQVREPWFANGPVPTAVNVERAMSRDTSSHYPADRDVPSAIGGHNLISDAGPIGRSSSAIVERLWRSPPSSRARGRAGGAAHGTRRSAGTGLAMRNYCGCR